MDVLQAGCDVSEMIGVARSSALPDTSREQSEEVVLNLLWAIVVILVVLWLLGLVIGFAGGLIHLLLIIAIVVVLYNVFVGRRAT